MHKIALNPGVVEKVLKRRGRRHAFADFRPARAALLVIDMQAIYLDPDLAEANDFFVPHYRDIVPNINRIAKALRESGGTVAWVINAVTPESQKSWSFVGDRLWSEMARKNREEAYREGSKGAALWKGLDVEDGDLKVKKTRYSAFIQGASTLEEQLRSRAIDTIIVTGVGTGTCCESTARDAMMLNFATIMVSDANACATDDEHNASLTMFYKQFGDVMSADEVIGYMRANA